MNRNRPPLSLLDRDRAFVHRLRQDLRSFNNRVGRARDAYWAENHCCRCGNPVDLRVGVAGFRSPRVCDTCKGTDPS